MPNYLKILAFLLPLWALGQNTSVDSLKNQLKTSKSDSTSCRLMVALMNEMEVPASLKFYNDSLFSIVKRNLNNKNLAYRDTFLRYKGAALTNYGSYFNKIGDKKSAIDYYIRAIAILHRISARKDEASAIINMGLVFNRISLMDSAMNCFQRALVICKQINDKPLIGHCYSNIGLVQKNQGMMLQALESYNASLKTFEQTDDYRGIAVIYNNIGRIYLETGDLEKALNYFNGSAYYFKKVNVKEGECAVYANIAVIYLRMGQREKGFNYNCLALKTAQVINDLNGISNACANIAECYFLKKESQKGLYYIERSQATLEKTKDKRAMVGISNTLGQYYFSIKNYAKASEYFNKSIEICKVANYPKGLIKPYKGLSDIYRITNESKKAFEVTKRFVQMRDSTNNEDIRKAALRSQLKYEYEKKATADSTRVAEEKKLSNIQLQKDENQRYLLYGGILLTLVFGGFIVNRLIITQKQKNVINEQKNIAEKQKQILEHKQKEILDSIHYAKRIQQSLLPTEKYLERIFKHLIS